MTRALLALLLLLAQAAAAHAQTLGGPSIAATQIVEDLLADVGEAGLAIVGIGLFALALSFFAGLAIERFVNTIVGGAVIAAGVGVTTMVLGATPG